MKTMNQVLKEYAESTIDNWVEPQDDLEPMTRSEAVEALQDESHQQAECAIEWLNEDGISYDYSEVVDFFDKYE